MKCISVFCFLVFLGLSTTGCGEDSSGGDAQDTSPTADIDQDIALGDTVGGESDSGSGEDSSDTGGGQPRADIELGPDTEAPDTDVGDAPDVDTPNGNDADLGDVDPVDVVDEDSAGEGPEDTSADVSADVAPKEGNAVIPDPLNVVYGDTLQFGQPLSPRLVGPVVGHILSARLDAGISIEASSPSGQDLVLHVFGPASGADFDKNQVAANDDANGLDPAVEFSSPADSKYLVVVSRFDGQPLDAPYEIVAQCDGEACAYPGFGGGPCPLALEYDAVDCAQALLIDPESGVSDFFVAIELCIDAEPLAGPYDNSCMPPQRAIFCGVDYSDYWWDVSANCFDQAYYGFKATECVFGGRYQDLFDHTRVVPTYQTVLTSASPLSPIEEKQLVAAVFVASYEPENAAEVFSLVDSGEVFQTQLAGLGGDLFVAYEFGAGDNSYGAVFFHDSDNLAAKIIDGGFDDCVAPDLGGSGCESDSECGGLECVGLYDGIGKCASTAPVGGEGDACAASASSLCPPGLYCAGLSFGNEGICQPAWMVGKFEATPFFTIPDADPLGVGSTIEVNGLATVSIDVLLTARIIHPAPGQLTVTLRNPAGTEVVVWDEPQSLPGFLMLDQAVWGFPGDESANGPWTLHAVDKESGNIGYIESWSLLLSSRYD
jgi:subtilisin-like proprotein convertase family protein